MARKTKKLKTRCVYMRLPLHHYKILRKRADEQGLSLAMALRRSLEKELLREVAA